MLFAAVAILTLALGTGANTAIFQLVKSRPLRTLPVANAHELVEVAIGPRQGPEADGSSAGAAAVASVYERIRQDAQLFPASRLGQRHLRPVDGGDPAGAGDVGQRRLLQTLGVAAQAGRVFTASDDVRADAPRRRWY